MAVIFYADLADSQHRRLGELVARYGYDIDGLASLINYLGPALIDMEAVFRTMPDLRSLAVDDDDPRVRPLPPPEPVASTFMPRRFLSLSPMPDTLKREVATWLSRQAPDHWKLLNDGFMRRASEAFSADVVLTEDHIDLDSLVAACPDSVAYLRHEDG